MRPFQFKFGTLLLYLFIALHFMETAANNDSPLNGQCLRVLPMDVSFIAFLQFYFKMTNRFSFNSFLTLFLVDRIFDY